MIDCSKLKKALSHLEFSAATPFSVAYSVFASGVSVDVLVWDEIGQDFREHIVERYVVFECNDPLPSAQ
ncbi:MAG: hypothetical protein CK528_02760 [Alcaligenaceae bacterium]|nr:MAG: hypothetical protein CK528_02760 [Alcaligenaceae bacterium]